MTKAIRSGLLKRLGCILLTCLTLVVSFGKPEEPLESSSEADSDKGFLVTLRLEKSGLNIRVTELAKDLHTPWAIDFAPDGRLFFTERPGRIRVLKDGQLDPESWIILDDVVEYSASGLLGLAIDPCFASNRFVYVAYTYRNRDGHLQDRLVRLYEDPVNRRGVFDRILLDYGVDGGIHHHGGRVKFGPDGKLYWTTGDLGRPPLAQDIAVFSGKILRINPDGTIPSDNPFPGSPVYSYGHRNSQGLAWQPGTHRLYAPEHGAHHRDELNIIKPGNNYGWPIISGDESHQGMVSPVVHSGDSKTWAPSGATFVTQGPWAGSLLFAGLWGESLYRLTFAGSDPHRVADFESILVGQFGRLRAVVEGPDGAIYVTTSNGDGIGLGTPGQERILRLSLR